MIEIEGDLLAMLGVFNAIAVTTNGSVSRHGWGVMGRGIAKEAALRWPSMPELLGHNVRNHGNHVCLLHQGDERWNGRVYALPVKHRWPDKADLLLIRRSLTELRG